MCTGVHVSACAGVHTCQCVYKYFQACVCVGVCVYTTQLHPERFPAYSNQDGTTYLGQVQGSCGGMRTGWLE